MKGPISSAGLLYLYLTGFEDHGDLYIQQINTYQHIDVDFYQQTMQKAEEEDQDVRSVHIFAVIGAKEKTDKVCSIVETELQAIFAESCREK